MASCFPALRHRGDHPIRISQVRRERLLHEHVHAERRDLFRPFCMAAGRGAEDHHVRLGGFEALLVIGEHSIGRNGKLRGGLRSFAGDSSQIPTISAAGCSMRHPQQIAHVHVIEVDAGDAPTFHACLLSIASSRGGAASETSGAAPDWACLCQKASRSRGCATRWRCQLRPGLNALARQLTAGPPLAQLQYPISLPEPLALCYEFVRRRGIELEHVVMARDDHLRADLFREPRGLSTPKVAGNAALGRRPLMGRKATSMLNGRSLSIKPS